MSDTKPKRTRVRFHSKGGGVLIRVPRDWKPQALILIHLIDCTPDPQVTVEALISTLKAATHRPHTRSGLVAYKRWLAKQSPDRPSSKS